VGADRALDVLLELTTEDGSAPQHSVDIEPSQLLPSLFPREERPAAAARAVSLLTPSWDECHDSGTADSSTSWGASSFHFQLPTQRSGYPYAAGSGRVTPNGLAVPRPVAAPRQPAAQPPLCGPPAPSVAAGVFAGQRCWWPAWEGGKPQAQPQQHVTVAPAAQAAAAAEDGESPLAELLQTLQSGSDDCESDAGASSMPGSIVGEAAAAAAASHVGRSAAQPPINGKRSRGASPSSAAPAVAKSAAPSKSRPYEPHWAAASPAPSPRPAAKKALDMAAGGGDGNEDEDTTTDLLLADIMGNVAGATVDSGQSEVKSADAELKQLVKGTGDGGGGAHFSRKVEQLGASVQISGSGYSTSPSSMIQGSLGSDGSSGLADGLSIRYTVVPENPIIDVLGVISRPASASGSSSKSGASRGGRGVYSPPIGGKPRQPATLHVAPASWDNCNGWTPHPGGADGTNGTAKCANLRSAAASNYCLTSGSTASRARGRSSGTGTPPSSAGSVSADTSSLDGGTWHDS